MKEKREQVNIRAICVNKQLSKSSELPDLSPQISGFNKESNSTNVVNQPNLPRIRRIELGLLWMQRNLNVEPKKI